MTRRADDRQLSVADRRAPTERAHVDAAVIAGRWLTGRVDTDDVVRHTKAITASTDGVAIDVWKQRTLDGRPASDLDARVVGGGRGVRNRRGERSVGVDPEPAIGHCYGPRPRRDPGIEVRHGDPRDERVIGSAAEIEAVPIAETLRRDQNLDQG